MKKKTTQKIAKKTPKKTLLENMTIENKADYTLAIVEEIRDNFKVFGEGMTSFWKEIVSLRVKTDAIFEEVGKMRVDISQIKERLNSIESRMSVTERELMQIKIDIAEIKKTLTAKADMKYISLFEARVARIEKKMSQ